MKAIRTYIANLAIEEVAWRMNADEAQSRDWKVECMARADTLSKVIAELKAILSFKIEPSTK